MKIQKILVMMFFCMGLSIAAMAHPVHPRVSAKKIYVKNQCVKITPRWIVVKVNNRALKFRALRTDRKGLFVLKKDLLLSPRSQEVLKEPCNVCHQEFDSPLAAAEHDLEAHVMGR